MSTQYYVRLTDAKGADVSADGGSLFEISDFGFQLEQAAQASKTTPGGTGNVDLDSISLTVASSGLSTLLSTAFLNGTRFSNLDLFAVASSAGGSLSSTPAVHDGFSTVYVTGDTVNPETGAHTFTLQAADSVKQSAAQFDSAKGAYTGTTVTGATTGGSFGTTAKQDFTQAVTTTAAADQNLETYVRFTDAGGNVLGGSTVGVGPGGWIRIDSASFGGEAAVGPKGSTGAPVLSGLDLTFAPGILEPTLLSTMTSAGQRVGIELASYARVNGTTTLVDDYRFGDATIVTSTRTSDAAVHYTFDYSNYGTLHSGADATTSLTYSELIRSTTAKYLPTQAAPRDGIDHIQAGRVATGESDQTQYYVQLTDGRGNIIPDYAAVRGWSNVQTGAPGPIITPAGPSLFQVNGFSFELDQEGNSSSTIGGSGVVDAGTLTLTVGTGKLSAILSNVLASGSNIGRLNNLDLFATRYDATTQAYATATHTDFNTLYVTRETVDAATGAHTFTLNYTGGVRESASQVDASTGKATGTTVTAATTSGNFGPETTPDFTKTVSAYTPGDTAIDTFVRFTDSTGAVLGGSTVGTGSGGWIRIDSAKIDTQLGFSENANGSVSLSPGGQSLDLTFAPGILEPTLLSTSTLSGNSGQRIGIEVASYASGSLLHDYRFGNAAIASLSRTSDADVHYTFDYTQLGTSQATSKGYAQASYSTTNSTSSLPNQAAPTSSTDGTPGQVATTSTGEGHDGNTHYYVHLTDAKGAEVSADGGSVFAISDFSFGLTQPNVAIGSGKANLEDISLTVASSGLSTLLSKAFLNGTQFSNLDLFAVGQSANGSLSATPAVHGGFSTVYVSEDHVDPETGVHTFTLNSTGGLKVSAAQQSTDTGAYTGATVTTTKTGGSFGTTTTPDFTKAVTTTAAADQNLETYVRFTDAGGSVLGGSTVTSTGSGGWIRIDSASFGGEAAVGPQGPTGAPVLAALDLTFAPGTLEPTLLSTMTSAGQRVGIELASYARVNGTPTLVDDYRFGDATIGTSTRTSDAAVHYSFNYDEYGTSHYGTDATTSASYSEITGSTATKYLPNQIAPLNGLGSTQIARVATGESSVACYVTGTRILTSCGEVLVEALSVGDLVVTASGEHRPIRWIGHRHTDCARHPEPIRVQPVRITAGAVAPGIPARDLRVSPDHALAFDGVLVKATRLVNGVSILRESVPSVIYWHVELDSHDLLVANGMPAESYIEADNRHAFENAGAVLQAHPEFEAKGDYAARTCLTLVEGGERLKAIRAGLFARIADRFTGDPDLRLVADGVELTPLFLEGNRYRFDVPEGTTALRLVSRSAVPSEVQGNSGDHRCFGVLIRNLTIDGAPADYDSLGEGWNAQAPGRDHRWTDGDAALLPARSIGFVATALERYPIALEDTFQAKAA